VLFSSADIPGEIIDVFIARQSQIEARNADFRRFSRAWFSAVRDWEGDSQSAASRLAPRLGMTSDAFVDAMSRVRLITLDENRRRLGGDDRAFLETIRRFAATVERHGGTAAPGDVAALLTGDALPVAEVGAQ